MPSKKTPWLDKPFTFQPLFPYATGAPRAAAGKPGKGGGKKPEPTPDGDRITTQAVNEEGAAPPAPPGKTTPAIGEEGTGNVPTTTIAKGEEG